MFFGNTLLKGCALDWHGTFILNMKEVLSMFMTTVIKCHSLSYDIFNANMTFGMTSWHKP